MQQLINLRWEPAIEDSFYFFAWVMNTINPLRYAHPSSFPYKHSFRDSSQLLEFQSLRTQHRLFWCSPVPETSPSVESHQTSFHPFHEGPGSRLQTQCITFTMPLHYNCLKVIELWIWVLVFQLLTPQTCLQALRWAIIVTLLKNARASPD